MKIIKYTFPILALLLFVSCQKNVLLFNTTPVDATDAEFQFHYFEPITNVAANYIDSLFVNGVLYSSVNGSGQLLPYNGVPGGDAGRFFSVKSGNVHFQLYRGANIVYDRTVSLSPGKQNIFVYDLSKDPVIFDNGFPYKPQSYQGNASTWGTDSICLIAFYNFLYEDANTPYPGKIQYQYQHKRTGEWTNMGPAVGFGEATPRMPIIVVKEVALSASYCRVDYRIVDENGNVLQVMNTAGGMVNYSDYWTAYVGRVYMHLFGGVRTAAPVPSVRQWTSQ